jgi:hypothetical protein
MRKEEELRQKLDLTMESVADSDEELPSFQSDL